VGWALNDRLARLYYVNPLAFEILFAEEDDEDAIQNAIGQSMLGLLTQGGPGGPPGPLGLAIP
jgi:hypothetical protein